MKKITVTLTEDQVRTLLEMVHDRKEHLIKVTDQEHIKEFKRFFGRHEGLIDSNKKELAYIYRLLDKLDVLAKS